MPRERQYYGGNPEPEHNSLVGVLPDEHELEEIVQKVDDCREGNGHFHREKDREYRHKDSPETKAREKGQPGSEKSCKTDNKVDHCNLSS